ncbi:hypothetical protein [Nannocystis pusilla]|uniref:hypothetical protein n=1 Tax=Nannocystis pusilla TaxID=889268 RepID=UPI003DA1FA0E
MNSPARSCSFALALALVSACPGEPATTSEGEPSSSTDATTAGSTVTSDGATATTAGEPTATAEPTTSSTSTASTGDTTTTSGPEEAGLWLVPLVSAEGASAHSVVLAENGDVVVAGVFGGTLELGDEALVSAGGLDLFAARWTAAGELLWARRFGGPGDEHEATIAAGDDGHLLLVAEFREALELPGLPPLVSLGLSDILVLQLDAAGELQWARSFGSPGLELEPRAVLDGAGDIVLSAAFESIIDLGGGPLVAADARDLLLAKLDAGGSHVWSKTFGNLADVGAHDLAIGEDGDVAVAGWFANSIDLGGGPFSGGGAYLAVFDGDSGEHRWSKQLGGGNSAGCGARFAADGGLLLSGWFQGSIDFGTGPLVATDADADHFAARYDEGGELAWAGVHGGPGVDSGCGVAAGPGGSWVLGGTFNRQIDFGGELLTKSSLRAPSWPASTTTASTAGRCRCAPPRAAGSTGSPPIPKDTSCSWPASPAPSSCSASRSTRPRLTASSPTSRSICWGPDRDRGRTRLGAAASLAGGRRLSPGTRSTGTRGRPRCCRASAGTPAWCTSGT